MKFHVVNWEAELIHILAKAMNIWTDIAVIYLAIYLAIMSVYRKFHFESEISNKSLQCCYNIHRSCAQFFLEFSFGIKFPDHLLDYQRMELYNIL